MRVAYFGSPDDAVAPLRALVAGGHEVVLAVTQPDRKRGRGGALVASAVKHAAADLGVRVLTPERSREVVDDVRDSGAQLGVVVAFGQMLPQSLLDAVPYGFVNLHFSLLPRWRGAAPVERALLAGDTETGVCLMKIVKELDAGPVYACERVPIGENDDAGHLHERLVAVGTALLLAKIDAIPAAVPEPQEGEATYAGKLSVEEFRLDPRQPARLVARVVRAGNPRPGAWCTVGGRRLKVWSATWADAPAGAAPGTLVRGAEAASRGIAVATSDGLLLLETVQPEGKPRMAARDWLRGSHAESIDLP